MTSRPDFLPIFIGGCPRSGTTFLGDRLGALLNARVTPESQFKRRILTALADHDNKRAVDTLEADKVYRLWQERPTKDALLACKGPAEFFSKLVFPNGAESDEAQIWVDHTPNNLDDFVALREAFPKARFISLQRDGRAVFASVRKLEWGPKNPIQTAHWWAARTAPGLAASLTFPDVCIAVQYEDLARGDISVWTDLVRFATGDNDREITTAMLQSHRSFDVPSFTRHQHTLVGSPPSNARAEAWRNDLSPREIELFEANAGALLDTLGYQRNNRYPQFPTRGEMIRMGEWPIRITAQPKTRIKLARRWRKVKKPSGGSWS